MLNHSPILSTLSRAYSIPLLGKILSRSENGFDDHDLMMFRNAQRLAYQGALEISRMIKPGWTESQTAKMLDIYLRDHGVKSFFHFSFAWFGDRAGFKDFKTYNDFFSKKRELQENEVIILDTAPIVEGYPADIGYTFSLQPDQELDFVMNRLRYYRELILHLFNQPWGGDQIWHKIDEQIKADGFTNAHKEYPLAVLGHKLYPVPLPELPSILRPFGWHTYWAGLTRGFITEALGPFYKGSLNGLWAIEPHVSYKNFGAKFEEMLFVKDGVAQWLDDQVPHLTPETK